MLPLAALLVCFLYGLGLLWHEHRRRTGVSPAVDLVVLWLLLISSRPLSGWLGVAAGGSSAAAAYDEGSPLDAAVYMLLLLLGLAVLRRRRVSLARFGRANAWLLAFFVYWGLSVLWADLPLVTFRRWVKDVGNVVLVLVVLTEDDPHEAAKAVFFRCAAVLMPLSVVLIRFYPEIGRTYHVWSGEMMYVGAATHKNSLGLLTLACGLPLLAGVLESRATAAGTGAARVSRLGHLSLLALTAWLLVQSRSATSLLCAAVGAGLLVALQAPLVRRHVVSLQAVAALAAGALWLADSWHDLYRYVVVDLLGRDLTLTTRTDIWPLLLAKVDNPLLGAGFSSFWSGERLAVLYERLGIIQAHNGYLETYLNGGLAGVALLACVLLAGLRSATLQLGAAGAHPAPAALALAVLAAAIVGNLSEAVFSTMNPLWFAVLLALARYPREPSVPPLHEAAGVPAQPNTAR